MTDFCINELLNDNNYVKDLLSKFKGESEFDIKIVSKGKVYRNGKEVNGKTSFSPSSNVITIYISTEKAANRSVLSVARTIIHEYVHADIFRKVYTKESAPNGDAIFKNTYEQYESKIYKANVHHNTMAELYQESISDALKELHSEKMSRDRAFISNNGDKNLDIYYDALSWQGLRSEHEIIWEVMPETRKKALNEALSEFDIASTKNCN